VARAPSEEPQGLVYEPELLSVDEEAGLLETHSIPPTKELRYSITFRTPRDGKAP
jgi:hypothetical protein